MKMQVVWIRAHVISLCPLTIIVIHDMNQFTYLINETVYLIAGTFRIASPIVINDFSEYVFTGEEIEHLNLAGRQSEKPISNSARIQNVRIHKNAFHPDIPSLLTCSATNIPLRLNLPTRPENHARQGNAPS